MKNKKNMTEAEIKAKHAEIKTKMLKLKAKLKEVYAEAKKTCKAADQLHDIVWASNDRKRDSIEDDLHWWSGIDAQIKTAIDNI